MGAAEAQKQPITTLPGGQRFAYVLVAGLLLFCGTIPSTTFAADEKFRGVSIKPLSGNYLVLKDVNIRGKPKTKSRRVGRLKAGEWVQAIGRPKDASWIAIKKKGKPLGFVFAPVLVPIIDGSLKKSVKGKVRAKRGPICNYTIRFTGKSKVQGEIFKTSDYEVFFDCAWKGKPVKFTAPMFITEGPYKSTQKALYQIAIDVLQVDTTQYDVHFSTIFIYNRSKNQVVFDGLTVKELGVTPPKKKKRAKNVVSALKGAIEIAVKAWGPKVWKAIAKKKPNN